MIQRAFREAMLALPPEEYDWFDVQARSKHASGGGEAANGESVNEGVDGNGTFGVAEPDLSAEPQRQFFEHAGPLFSVMISPAASTVAVNESRRFTALPRDRSRRRVEEGLQFRWTVMEGGGSLSGESDQQIEYRASSTPGLARLNVLVQQREVECSAEALITVTDSIVPVVGTGAVNTQGLPGYTFERAAGELWRSRFDAARNIIVA